MLKRTAIWGCCLAACFTGYACSSDSTNGAGTGAGQGAGGAGSGGMGSGGGVTCISGLSSLSLTPADQKVTLDGSSASPLGFVATGSYDDGHSAEVPGGQLNWSVSRGDAAPPGDIANGVLTPNAHAGGLVTVTATDGCITAETSVSFFVDATIGKPANPGDWTAAPTTGPGAAEIVYPSDQTRFPRNIYRTLFQWHSQGHTAFRLIFEGPNSKVTVYTDGAHGLCTGANPAAGCWEVDENTWSLIASSNAGTTATWTVDALDTSTKQPTVRRSAAITLGFSKEDVKGAIFYWSTTSAGIRRGRISQQDPEDYIVGKPNATTYPNSTVKCVACHTVSRDGKYMVAPTDASDGKSLWVMEITAQAPPKPLVTSVANTGGHGFATLSPDNNHVVVSFKQDKMWMVDRKTGAHEADLPTTSLGGGTHPDWSPTGKQLVFATGTGDGPKDASLAMIPWTGTAWGTASVLLAPPKDMTNLFPMFSPDGAWIAFVQGTSGGHGDNSAQLWIVPEAGNSPVELVQANRVVSNQSTDGQHQNSQPTWAPAGDLNWIAFNTKRPYGVVRPAGGMQQIWVSAIDVNKVKGAKDGSYPAFRVPFQGLDENNHRAFWALDVGTPGGGGGGGGSGGGGSTNCNDILNIGDTCDPLNDCCETGALCDTRDSGTTYECVNNLPR